MFDAGYFECIAKVVETDTVVSNAKAAFGRINLLKAFDVSFARVCQMGYGMEDAQCGGLINSAKFNFGSVIPDNLLPHSY
jgi:hypothetical protein